jgi:pilus assembly protein CpaB
MSIRTLVVIGLAMLCGLSAAAGVNELRRQKTGALAMGTVPVVVAAVDIPRGVTVTEELLGVRDWPQELVPPGALKSKEEALERATLGALMTNEPVLDRKLSSKEGGRGLAALIPPGMRAFTINTPTAYLGVAGFVLPGNKVDVLLTVTERGINDATGGGSTTTLLQNIEILAVDQKLDAPNENKVDPKELQSVTLLVTPDQATKLGLAQQKGVLHLSLRNAEDVAAADTAPVTLKDLRYLQEELTGPAETPAAAPAVVVVHRPQALRIRTLRGRSSGSVPLIVSAPQ